MKSSRLASLRDGGKIDDIAAALPHSQTPNRKVMQKNHSGQQSFDQG
jgi:hypothetical protein